MILPECQRSSIAADTQTAGDALPETLGIAHRPTHEGYPGLDQTAIRVFAPPSLGALSVDLVASKIREFPKLTR